MRIPAHQRQSVGGGTTAVDTAGFAGKAGAPGDTGREARDRQLFENVADEYFRKDLLPASRRARRRRLLQTLAALPADAKRPEGRLPDILEVGCGAGFSAQYLHGRYRRFVGIDYSEPLIELARRHNKLPGCEFVAGNAKSLQATGGDRFDLLVMVGVLHHIDDPTAALAAMVGLLRPGGWLAANEPQPNNPAIQTARRVRAKVDAHYSPEQQYPTAAELRDQLEAAGLMHVRSRPQGLLSTPFAEVPFTHALLQTAARPLSAMACGVDMIAEVAARPLMSVLSWNNVVIGQRPHA